MNYAIIKDSEIINMVISHDGEPGYPFPYDSIIPDLHNVLAKGMKHNGENWYLPEVEQNNWQHPEYPMRIIAPTEISTAYPELLFEMTVRRKLPIEEVGQSVHIYCTEIAEEDAATFAYLQGEGIITVENYPGG